MIISRFSCAYDPVSPQCSPLTASFLSNLRLDVDITLTPEDNIPCTLGYTKNIRQTCNQVLNMAGTYGDLDLLRNASLPHADLIVVHNMRDYQLDFNTSGVDTGVVYDLEFRNIV